MGIALWDTAVRYIFQSNETIKFMCIQESQSSQVGLNSYCLHCLHIVIRLRPKGTQDRLLKASLDGSVLVSE